MKCTQTRQQPVMTRQSAPLLRWPFFEAFKVRKKLDERVLYVGRVRSSKGKWKTFVAKFFGWQLHFIFMIQQKALFHTLPPATRSMATPPQIKTRPSGNATAPTLAEKGISFSISQVFFSYTYAFWQFR